MHSLKNVSMSGKYLGALRILGSRLDDKATAKLSEIILGSNEGIKWDAIGSIKKYKNEKMLPILCQALRRHTDFHTDRLIVRALDAIDNPSALQTLLEEKDKLHFSDAQKLAEQAIHRWQPAQAAQKTESQSP